MESEEVQNNLDINKHGCEENDCVSFALLFFVKVLRRSSLEISLCQGLFIITPFNFASLDVTRQFKPLLLELSGQLIDWLIDWCTAAWLTDWLTALTDLDSQPTFSSSSPCMQMDRGKISQGIISEWASAWIMASKVWKSARIFCISYLICLWANRCHESILSPSMFVSCRLTDGSAGPHHPLILVDGFIPFFMTAAYVRTHHIILYNVTLLSQPPSNYIYIFGELYRRLFGLCL